MVEGTFLLRKHRGKNSDHWFESNTLRHFLNEDNMANPMQYKTGKTRLGPLSLAQLNDLLEKSSKPKDKAKIRNRIRVVESRAK